MGHRLSKIITRTGDDGTTGLGDGSRVPKDSTRIEAIGAVDELNSWIGLLRGTPALPAQIADCLLRIQHDLFDLGGELAVPGYSAISEAHVLALEEFTGQFNDPLPPLKEFILPGGGEAAGRCHVARTTARRAERRCWALARETGTRGAALLYLNRLSDLLFVMARVANRRAGLADVEWEGIRR